MSFSGVYTRKDRPGRMPTCTCVPRGHEHAWCRSCLIMIGPNHHEQTLQRASLPTLTDTFDAGLGVWIRGVIWQEEPVCGYCADRLRLGDWQPTLRLLPIAPAQRKARMERWLAETGNERPRRRHLGGYVRRSEGWRGA